MKFIKPKRYILIPSVFTAVVVICFILFVWACISGLTAQLAPSTGIWYSEELCLQLSYDTDDGSVWHTQDGDIPCLFSFHSQSSYITVFERGEKFAVDQGFAYRTGNTIMVFNILKFEDNLMIVQDYFQNKYTFSRLR